VRTIRLGFGRPNPTRAVAGDRIGHHGRRRHGEVVVPEPAHIAGPAQQVSALRGADEPQNGALFHALRFHGPERALTRLRGSVGIRKIVGRKNGRAGSIHQVVRIGRIDHQCRHPPAEFRLAPQASQGDFAVTLKGNQPVAPSVSPLTSAPRSFQVAPASRLR